MKASTPLKDLPGFDDAMARAIERDEDRRARGSGSYPLELVGEIVIPSLKRVSSWVTLDQLAMLLSGEQADERRRIRLVPSPRLAANDCEASQ